MRLIDAEPLMRKISGICIACGYDTDCEERRISDAMDSIKNAPTIDPVKNGRWVKVDKYHDTSSCSRCHWAHNFDEHFNHCPLCGSKMDEVEDV